MFTQFSHRFILIFPHLCNILLRYLVHYVTSALIQIFMEICHYYLFFFFLFENDDVSILLRPNILVSIYLILLLLNFNNFFSLPSIATKFHHPPSTGKIRNSENQRKLPEKKYNNFILKPQFCVKLYDDELFKWKEEKKTKKVFHFFFVWSLK